MSEAEDKKARKSSITVEQELRDINERRLARAFGKGDPAPDVPVAEEEAKIREMYAHMSEAYSDPIWPNGHATIVTLLRLLDAAREDLREVREAAADVLETIDHYGTSHHRLAAALKEPPTRTQGESS